MSEEESYDSFPELRIAVHPGIPEVWDTDFYKDFYRWYGKHPLAEQLRRWVAVTPEGEVVGHLSGMPQAYRIDGRRIVAHTPGDYMVLPGYGFQALSLMRHFFRDVENCVACDMAPAVIAVETRMGAEVAGEMQYAAKLLDVSRLPVPQVPGGIKRLFGSPDRTAVPRGRAADDENVIGPPQRQRAPIPAPVKGALNRTLAAVDGVLCRDYARGVEVEEIERFDGSFDELFEKIATVIPCLPERDSAFLNWRYGPGSPQAPVKVLGVRGAQGLLGYAVLKVSASGEDGYILDLSTLPGYREVARALLRESVHYFRREGACIIRYRFVESPTSARAESLLRLGFYYRKGRSNNLLVKLADPTLHETSRYLGNWSYTTGDGEATFMLR